MNGGKLCSLEITYPERQPDGSEKLMKLVLTQIFDADGNPVGPATEETIDG